MPNIIPVNFVASTTDMMAYIYGQFSPEILLILSVILVGALAGILINHLKK